MKNNIYISSTNENKIEEINAFFRENKINFEIKKPKIDLSKIIEDGETFYENAKIKAIYLASRMNYSEYVLADDSGLCIEELNGFPGINSARFTVDGKTDYKTKNQYLIQRLGNNKNKKAKFVCCLVLIDKNRNLHKFESFSEGLILENKNEIKRNFGFDPIFYSIEAKKFFSDLDENEKNKYSHRGKSLCQLSTFLNNIKNS